MSRTEDLVLKYDGQDIRVSARLRIVKDDFVVFLHGFGCAKECFAGAFHVDSLSEFSICTFDFPGHGESGQPGIDAYSLQSYADVTNILIDRLAPARISMVCHSMGGAVGLIASQERADLAAFVNVEGNLVTQDCGIVSRATAGQSLNDFKRRGFNDFLQSLRSSNRSDERAWARSYALADPVALHETACSLVEWSDSGKLLDLFESLKNKIYIYGDQDPRPYLVSQFKNVPTYSVPSSGHFVMHDNPSFFYELVSEILSTTHRSEFCNETPITSLRAQPGSPAS
jgi:pimeloyl-ACP methyl ester carboxylesterase